MWWFDIMELCSKHIGLLSYNRRNKYLPRRIIIFCSNNNNLRKKKNWNIVLMHFYFITEWWKWILFFVNISKKEKSKVIRATAFLIISLLYNTFGPKHKARAKSKRNILTKIFNGSAFQSSLLFYHFVSITYIL